MMTKKLLVNEDVNRRVQSYMMTKKLSFNEDVNVIFSRSYLDYIVLLSI